MHRDVKPQNVIVPDAPRSAAGVAKLADFGVAHLAGDEPLTRTGDVVGTLAYMAPEQAAGRRVDERADLYSLALVLYEALAGTNPVRAGSPAATARRVGTVLPAAQALAQGPAAAADRRDRPRAAPAAGGARDARRARGRAHGRAARGLRRRRDRRPPPARAHRAAPAPARRSPAPPPRALAGGLLAAALAWTGQPVAAALAAVLAVALLPRARLARHGRRPRSSLLAVEQPDAAVVAAAAALPVPLLLYRRGTAWSVPALAPLLGLATLAGAYPALAGRAARLVAARRARRARRLVGCSLLRRCATKRRSGGSSRRVRAPQARCSTRPCGRSPRCSCPGSSAAAGSPLDVVAASAWAAALGAGTAAAAEAIGAPEPPGLVLATFVAGLLAVAVPHLRRVGVVEP